ncbi:peptide/nickel transport system substrate-binding protein [Mumia flava]|uniref:Peptide/nickel transport system substrate-binding protein n=1 Tax=Mumia flava TaxID=1348852 RepID=A0A0B2B2G5_9ACTN|nr:ABC transporter substrate-binding protein [Mumia flava]PJJ57627.1 peptide/nickel transport system substrate-binding protein [Mumia flava]
MKKYRAAAAIAGAAALTLGVGACGAGNDGSDPDSGSDSLVLGTTDKVVSIDPAGAYDNGSLMVQTQVYQYLLNFPEGADSPQPDAAESCDFDTPTTYTCTLKDGLTFANGNPLTAESVAFSFQRIVDIDDPNGPASLLTNMASVEATDDTTVVFTLKTPNDQTFPQVLVTSAGPIVDESVYPADAVLSDEEAVEAQGFSGPYTIGSYEKNQLAEFEANDDYDGAYNAAQIPQVTIKYYADANNLKLDIEKQNIDVAWRSLSPTDIESLEDTDGVTVHTGAGGELRYIVFNLKTMPGADDAQKLAVRQAAASLVDRQAISEQVYKGTYVPAYSVIPEGLPGATTPFEELYGSAPDADAAAKYLSDAGVSTPVELNLQYNPDHYGSSSDQEYNEVKRQLEESGLFTVNLQSTEWTTYSEERVADAYPAYQLGWFPDFPDADNYLTPFFAPNNFLQSHYEDPAMTKLLDAERTESDPATREDLMGQAQQMVAEQLPILPLLSGAQVAVATDEVQGVENTLDAAFKFRLTSLSK